MWNWGLRSGCGDGARGNGCERGCCNSRDEVGFSGTVIDDRRRWVGVFSGAGEATGYRWGITGV